jgi:uncharacterized membrane protein
MNGPDFQGDNAAAGPEAPRIVFDAHHRFGFALAAAAVTVLLLHGRMGLPMLIAVAWNAFAFTILVLAWGVLVFQDPFETRRNARLQDSSRTFLFVAVVGAAAASLLGVALLLGSAKALAPARLAIHLGLATSSIVLSWMLVHTLFALRYAHHFYRGAAERGRGEVEGGLVFVGDESPDYLDFAYFSFVIGMTFQVSDVQISAKGLRRLALVHGLISFAFNTAILALGVNLVASLVSPGS